MDINYLELVKNIISVAGGIGGLIYLGYFLKEKLRKKEVNLHYISGSYEIEKSNLDSNNINVIVEVAIHNNTNETISLTDIVGTIKYNKQKYAQNINSLLKVAKDTKDTKTERPSNYKEVTHFTIGPHTPIQKTLTFRFHDIIPNLIDRMWLSRFVGTLGGDVPLIQIDEREVLLNWEKYPLNLLLSVHINGKKLIQTKCPLYEKTSLNDENFSGSISIYDQVRIEKEFSSNEDISIVPPAKTKISFSKSI